MCKVTSTFIFSLSVRQGTDILPNRYDKRTSLFNYCHCTARPMGFCLDFTNFFQISIILHKIAYDKCTDIHE